MSKRYLYRKNIFKCYTDFVLEISSGLMKFKIPKQLEGYSIKDVALKKKFNIKLVALLNLQRVRNFIRISKRDIMYSENY